MVSRAASACVARRAVMVNGTYDWAAKSSPPLRARYNSADLASRPIMRLSHARSRYIYDLYYKRELISRELYDWLLKQKYADAE